MLRLRWQCPEQWLSLECLPFEDHRHSSLTETWNSCVPYSGIYDLCTGWDHKYASLPSCHEQPRERFHPEMEANILAMCSV